MSTGCVIYDIVRLVVGSDQCGIILYNSYGFRALGRSLVTEYDIDRHDDKPSTEINFGI